MTEIFVAKTIEEAKSMASKAFEVAESEISFEILEEPKKSLFGKVKGEAKVKAEYNKPELKKSDIAINYIVGILDKMKIDYKYTTQEVEGGIIINLETEETSFVIGRRGENLDALQYLASMVCNKIDEEYFRIILDSNGYREKRKNTLEDLARKISRNVLKSGRSTALEPMNPYERRIIHSVISEVEGVSSKSIGEEPYRKVIISSLNKRNDKFKKDFRDNKNNNNNNNSNHKKKNFESKSLDLKTSFEKDYKKPKPEDNIKAGLYGKIEF